MPESPLTLLQGTLDLLILRTLASGSNHGYGVSTLIQLRTDGTLAVEDAALYQALHRLEQQRLVSARWGLSENNRRAKYYRLTALGRRRLQAETARWGRYVEAVFKVLEPAAGEA
jgi:transcriptional regulator